MRKKELKSIFEESQFLERVIWSLCTVWSKTVAGDVIPQVQMKMEMYERRLYNPDYPDRPAYTDIVLALYQLAIRTYLESGTYADIRENIRLALEQCSNNQFGPFVKLTNPHHNPNQYFREWAIRQLFQIATSKEEYLPRYGRWKKGARSRLVQLAREGGLRFLVSELLHVGEEAVRLVPREMCEKLVLLPLRLTNGTLSIGRASLENPYALDDVRFYTGLPVEQFVVDEILILAGIQHYYS